VAAVALACAGPRARRGGETAPPVTAHHVIHIRDFRFAPSQLVVRVGDVVEWINDDAFNHSSFGDGGRWSSGELRPGARYRLVAQDTGRFPYHCGAHPTMRATLTVTPVP
jgi:plastocyanin